MTDPTAVEEPLTLEQLAERVAVFGAAQEHAAKLAKDALERLDRAMEAAQAAGKTPLPPVVPVVVDGVEATGQFAKPKVGDAIVVEDEEALVDFLLSIPDYEGEVKVEQVITTTIRSSFLTAYKTALLAGVNPDGKVYDMAQAKKTGEMIEVPGVRFVKGEGFKTPSFTGKKKIHEKLAELFAAGRQPLALTMGEPTVEVVVEEDPLPTAADVLDAKKTSAADVRVLAERLGVDAAGIRKLRADVAARLEETTVEAEVQAA